MKPPKLVVIALDAADSALVTQWAADGYLPNVARLLREGVSAEVGTPVGVLEGAIWPTILTSSTTATHGMYAYRQIVPGSYDLEIAMMADRLPIAPFWAYLSAAGKRVAVIDAPFAKPVKGLNGIQVTNWGGHDLWCWTRSSWPKPLIGELMEHFGDYPVPNCDAAPNRSLRDYENLRARLMEGVAKKTALLRHCLKMDDWELFFGVYSEAHCAGHQFWHFMDSTHPRHDPKAPTVLRHCVRDIYAAIDTGVGELLRDLSPGANVMLLLSHGMGPYYHGSHLLDEIIDRLGVNDFEEGADQVSADRSARDLREVAWRACGMIPSGLRQSVKSALPEVWVRSFWHWSHPEPQPVNPWIAKRVFQLPESNMTGLLRINLKGREPNGLVEPGEEYEKLCQRLAASLLAVQNADTGGRAVDWVAQGRDLYPGPRLSELPDLFVEWNHGSPIRRLSSSEIGIVEGVFPGHRTGSHWQGGTLIGRGLGFTQGKIAGMQTEDLAPTILDFFDVPVPRCYEGQSRLEILRHADAVRAM